MTAPVAVIDTNVVVAGLLTAESNSPVYAILDGMLSGRFRFLLSSPLLEEYRSVLLREKIANRHGLSEGEIDTLLQDIVLNAIIHEPSARESAPDPGDDHLFSLLADWRNATLVTGDKTLVAGAGSFHVLAPDEFLRLLS